MNTPSFQKLLSSLDNYQANALSVTQAQAIMLSLVNPITAPEQVSLRAALGRVLANDILSPINVPAHDNSAMDGYAFNADILSSTFTAQSAEIRLGVIGDSLAGHAFSGIVESGSCVRIMTGAVMPDDCDSVIPQELCDTRDSAHIVFDASKIKRGENRRFKGEDLQAGGIALRKGRLLTPADMGLIASLGIAELSVQRRLKVAIFSTGDELRSLGEPLDPACVYDSNRYTLLGMLERLGCDIIDMGVVPDQPQALEAALRRACIESDAVLTSGGVSVGAADYTKQVMAKLGEVEFWTIGMRPGRPMAFGQISSDGQSAFLFGLPGNPVAVMVSFYFFVRDAMHRLMGAEKQALLNTKALALHPIKKRAGRTEYQRGIAQINAQGLLDVSVTGSQGSGVLRSMSEANCMIVLADEQKDVGAGEMVDIIFFGGLL